MPGAYELTFERRAASQQASRTEAAGRFERQSRLSAFAKLQFQNVSHCQALVNIVDQATYQVRDIPRIFHLRTHTDAIIEDLQQVIVGVGMEGRGRGPHFAGHYVGATGFRPELRDEYNQIQHAAAGLIIGYRYGKLGEWAARLNESEEQDDLLYEATCPIGRWLWHHPQNYYELGTKTAAAISDGPCYAPFIRR